MQKRFMAFVFLGFLMFLLNRCAFADENTSPAPSANPTDNESVSRKLDKMADTQAEILKQLDEIKAELQIVKIRASQQ